ncbi:hypothetical protein AAFN85_07715 [Mucilaginibacter sp. CAU 1740]|uniref:hypothetical protein n=1 Tax=Mucilaginibacter sp. CAU 1740 TaxID=3140365 RepID=UPI00325AD031
MLPKTTATGQGGQLIVGDGGGDVGKKGDKGGEKGWELLLPVSGFIILGYLNIMAAEISYIVTKQIVDVPLEFPHFLKDGLTTIVINSYSPWVEHFIVDFDNGTLRAEYDPDNIFKVDEDFLPGQIYDLIRKLNLEYEEFGIVQDTLGGGCHAAFRSGKRIPGSYYVEGEALAYPFRDLLSVLEIDESSISKFHSCYAAERQYRAKLNL